MPVTSHDRGLTLLELAIAVLILSIGTVAALRALDQSRVAIGGSQDRVFTALAAANRAEELRFLGINEPLPQSVQLAGQNIRLSTVSSPTVGGLLRVDVRAQSPAGPSSSRVVFIPADTP